MEQDKAKIAREFLLVSDFDQTLSFNDSGIVLSDLLGLSGFEERIAGLSRIHMVQQGGELAYLLLHDPEFRRVRREHLVEVGKRIRLKKNIRLLSQLGWKSLHLFRGLGRAGRGDSIGARGHCARRSHHRHALSLRGHRRD